MSSAISPRYASAVRPARAVAAGLTWIERIALTIAVVEIPLQIDKYYMFHEADAKLGAVAGINVSVTTVAIGILYFFWLARVAVLRDVGRAARVVGLPMLVYLVAVFFSSFVATLPILSFFDLLLLTQAYLLFLFIANRIRTRDDLLVCFAALMLSLMCQSGIIFLLAAMGADNQRIEVGPLVFTVWDGQRHGGTMQSPVLAGSTMALMWLPIAVLPLVVRTRLLWNITMAATAAGLLAILLTQTRGAILTSAVGCLMIAGGMFWRGWLPKWTIGIGLLLALLSIVPLIDVYQKRIREGDGDSAIARKHLSMIALEMISEQPVLGYGAGNCHLAAEQFANQAKYRSEWYYTIHSKYLLVWVETGFFGLLAFLWLMGTGGYHALATWRLGDRQLAPVGLALGAALAGHSVHMAVDVFNSRTQVQMLWVILGIAAAVYQMARSEHKRRNAAPRLQGGVA